jgi:predicted RNA methylase
VLNLAAWHFAFRNDSARVTAYAEAIAATVKPGDVVADLGAGTGVMALLASGRAPRGCMRSKAVE